MFTPPDTELYNELLGTISTNLLLVGLLVMAFASYTTMALYERMQKPSFFRREVWLVLTSLSLAFGMWAMHFVWMNAVSLPLEMGVNYAIGILSFIPAFFSALLAFYLVDGPMKSCWRYTLAAVILAEGMTAMHFIGMQAMIVEAVIFYDWQLLLAGNIVGGLFVYLMLRFISSSNRPMVRKLMAPIFLTIGTVMMHYLGLIGTKFYTGSDQSFADHTVSHMGVMNTFIGIGVGILLVGMLLTTYIDGYVDYWIQNFDVLTKLPNRRKWERKLGDEQAIGDIAIWNFPDLPRINQLYGYQVGDAFLQDVAAVFTKWKPQYAQLYRVSGNRFLFYVDQTGRTVDFYKSLIVIQTQLDRLLLIKRKEMRYTCGLANADAEKTVKHLYKDAMRVVERATEAREWGLRTFNPAVHGVSYEQDVLRDITKALDDNQLYLVYQPKIVGKTEAFDSVEALLRWKHPELGVISPAVFVPILERDGRMGEVTDWIIREVCEQIHAWDGRKIFVPQVAINIPGDYVANPQLLDTLWKETQTHCIEPNRIELEITETSTAKSIGQAIAAMKRFKRYGFSVALDDFGTGVSSLSYLQQLPITTLKIDKSFADIVPASLKECAVLHAILMIGQSMDLRMVVEGVEKKSQVDFLLNLQPDLIFQGYYYARPMAADQLVDWLAEWKQAKVVQQ
ncbi:EAL domain-containing protein [Sporosarcina sp. PTS2304]|uniref:bifunctional diguanylate cyclase/phosphodiesterase n=1 Tax=Sporosarcina sp. PTS2304 TaxID=2283194 RepID=UPI000E0DF4FF|nr:EAL domain-containing protein [Sporosarcina sp. PTS2304]AXI00984.1 EAL domain-containing protein [Sporosarcina sp. PTS2304]